MKKYGFTLAEVLITLAIIGIVAALTIPSVISNYQQQEFKTGLKKAVSVLNEAIQTNIALEGETPYDNGNLYDYFKRHMSIIKTSNLNTCYDLNTGDGVKLSEGNVHCGEIGAAPMQNVALYKVDGMRFEIPYHQQFIDHSGHLYLYESGLDLKSDQYRQLKTSDYKYGVCGSYGLANNPNNTKNIPCFIVVDVNGDKKPNPSMNYDTETTTVAMPWGDYTYPANQSFRYSYPTPSDKKLQDVFTIMITDEKAIPFGVVAQRAMYSK